MRERTRPLGESEPANRRTRWTRSTLPGAAPLPRPRAPQIEPVRRSWILAGWQARLAVQAGISLDDFLRARLARYLGAVPVARGRLPVAVEIEDGQIRASPVPAEAPAPDRGPDPWLAPLVDLDGPAVRDELARLEVRAATLEGDIEAARRHADEVARRLAADVAAGIVVGPSGVDATAEQLGRAPVRSANAAGIALALGASAVVAETWQIAQPLLRGAGIDPTRLGTEASRAPLDVGFVAVFALGVAVALAALAHVALQAGSAALRADATDPRRRWNLAIAAGAPLLAALVAAAVTALPTVRPAEGAAHGPLVVLLVSVPFAAALALQAAAREVARRREDLAGALSWDRERARALGERARRLEEVSWASEDVRALERERDTARRRVEALSARAAAAARVAAENLRLERAALAHVAEGLVSALELDRYEFVRQAGARGADDLVAPRRRKAPEPAAAPPAPEPAPAGRMAS